VLLQKRKSEVSVDVRRNPEPAAFSVPSQRHVDGRPTVAALDDVYLAFVKSGTSRAHLVLDGISLDVKDGEFCTIVGPSGSGKSTILNLIAGLITPTEGIVRFGDRPVTGINRGVGYVTQDDNLLPWRTLQANVELALEFQGVPARERAARSEELIRRVGLDGFQKHYPHELSGGMRKRVSIIRTLIYETRMILMDEPFGPLDAQTRLILQNDLLALWERMRRSVLFVTHDLVEAIALSDRIIVLSAAPARIKRVYEVNLPRPRDVFHIHEQPGFDAIYDQLWTDIREEIRGRQDDAHGC
jgi:NitT/TauT family transport system ATP-binding protein